MWRTWLNFGSGAGLAGLLLCTSPTIASRDAKMRGTDAGANCAKIADESEREMDIAHTRRLGAETLGASHGPTIRVICTGAEPKAISRARKYAAPMYVRASSLSLLASPVAARRRTTAPYLAGQCNYRRDADEEA